MTTLSQPDDPHEPQAQPNGVRQLCSAILESMAAAVLVVDREQHLLLVNPAARRLLGLAEDGSEDDGALSVCRFSRSDRSAPLSEEEQPLQRALRGESVTALQVCLPAIGKTVHIDANPLRDDSGEPVGALAVLHAAPTTEEDDLHMLIAGVTDYAIMQIDAQGRIARWNPGAERITGVPAGDAVGRPLDDLFTQEDRAMGEPQRELEQARAAGSAENERWHVRRDGTRFWASGAVMPLWNADGTLRGYAKIMRDRTRDRLAEEQTRFLANHDPLTGLPNRVSFSNRLHANMVSSQRTGVPFALLLLDLDRFKYVNDTFGHHAGDLLLKEVALRIVSLLRETDFVARLGGDEFVVIQADASQPQAAETLARKLVLGLGRPFELDGQEVQSGASIGVCVYPNDAEGSVGLLKRADLALYRAKHSGRHNYQFYNATLEDAQGWKRDSEAALRMALRNSRFELYYQPQVELSQWKIVSVEALLRWNATDMETVLPCEFLDIVEQNGMILEIGEWALRESARQVRRWHAQGLPDLRLSVNCSARQFSDPRFVALIPAILADAGVAPSILELEVPESMLARQPEIKPQLAALRALGIRLTIDNFGTGATALRDFQDFTIDAFKIDKAFIEHLPHRREDAAIASAIVSLAHNLGVRAVAAGVETAEQLAYLRARECDGAQGFIFSPPVPAERLEKLMLTGHWSRINPLSEQPDEGFGRLH